MRTCPSVPAVADAPESLFERGHLWIQEAVDGARFRFQMQDSGLLVFGDRDRVYRRTEPPLPYRHAVRHVRDQLDRDALRTAAEAVESIVFCGVATHKHVVDYDWDRTPSFLGTDVWSAHREAFLPVDAVEQSYSRLGLTPLNTFSKEVRAVDFDPESYETPTSAWYDGPAAGSLVRNKSGIRAELPNPRVSTATPDPIVRDAEEFAAEVVTSDRVAATAAALDAEDERVTVESVSERVVETVVRAHASQLYHGESEVDMDAFRSAVLSLTQRYLDRR